MRVVDRGNDQVLQHADVVFRHHFGVERDLLQMLVAVHGHRHHAAAGGGLHRQLGHLLLQALLHLLRLLHHVLNVHRSSIVVFSTGKISSTACTVEFAIASAFNASGELFCAAGSSRLSSPECSRGEADPSATTTDTGTGLPATFSASDCSHAFCSSQCAFAFF